MNRSIILFILLSFSLPFPFFMPGNALAGSFKVTPTSVTFGIGEQTSVLKLTNLGNEDVTIQIDAREWAQQSEALDQYQSTTDIVFFPKIVSIPKGKEALVRIGYQQKHGAVEKTYRIFLQELPISKPGEMALKMTLTLSVPVFIEPLTSSQEWQLADAEIGEGVIKVTVKNVGNIHLVNKQIVAAATDNSTKTIYKKEKSGWYVLAGATKAYVLDFPKEICLKAEHVNIVVFAGRDQKSLQIPVQAEQCTDKPVNENEKSGKILHKKTPK